MCPANPAQNESAKQSKPPESSGSESSDSERFFSLMEGLTQAVIRQTEVTSQLLQVNQQILLAMAEDQAGIDPDDLPMYLTPPRKT